MSVQPKLHTLGNLPDEAKESFEKFWGMLPLVWAHRKGGTVRIHKDEVDKMGGYILDFTCDGEYFVLSLRKKD